MSSLKCELRRAEMSRIEVITITNNRNKSEKDMRGFLVKEFGALENQIFFIIKYIFNSRDRLNDPKSCMKWSMPGLSVLIEVFL